MHFHQLINVYSIMLVLTRQVFKCVLFKSNNTEGSTFFFLFKQEGKERGKKTFHFLYFHKLRNMTFHDTQNALKK